MDLIGEDAVRDDTRIVGKIVLTGEVFVKSVHFHRELEINCVPTRTVSLEKVILTEASPNMPNLSVVRGEGGVLQIQGCFISYHNFNLYGNIVVSITGSEVEDSGIWDNTGSIHMQIDSNTFTDSGIAQYFGSAGVFNVENNSFLRSSIQTSVTATIGNNMIDGAGTDGRSILIAYGNALIHGNNMTGSGEWGIWVGYTAQATVEGNNISGKEVGIRVGEEAVADLGGGSLGSAGGNTITGNGRNIEDERLSFSDSIYAKNNTWTDPQPSGTVNGPVDSPPNYFIENEGNSIIFSD